MVLNVIAAIIAFAVAGRVTGDERRNVNAAGAMVIIGLLLYIGVFIGGLIWARNQAKKNVKAAGLDRKNLSTADVLRAGRGKSLSKQA